MRVLFWTDLFKPYVGGIEVLAADLVPRLSMRGHTFHVVSSHGFMDLPDQDDLDGTPISRFPLRAILREKDLPAIIRVRRTLRELVHDFRPDVVHLFGVGSGMLFQRDSVPGAIPTILTLHNDLTRAEAESPDSLVHHTIRSSSWITACSTDLLARLREIVPDCTNRSSAIRNAVTPPTIPYAVPTFERPMLLCVGRLTHQKGLDVAIRAFALVADRNPWTRLVLAGDGDERSSLEALTRQLGVADRVDFLGIVPPAKIHQLLADSTVVVMPSRWEGLPVAAIEAAMAGRPIVGTRVSGIPEIVLDGRTGLLVDSESPKAVADAVTRLLADPSLAMTLGQAARAHALESFGMEQCVDAYDALYRHFDRTTQMSDSGV